MEIPLKGVVIGAGMIGSALDYRKFIAPLTHAGGYKVSPYFTLGGIYDENEEKKRKAGEYWDCPLYDSVEELLTKASPDVVSVCIPSNKQPDVLQRLLGYPIKAVIAEKPLSKNYAISSKIIDAYERAGIPLFVNYTRRYVPLYKELAQKFQNDEKVLTASIKYAKGLNHNGSHAIDTARLLFGDIIEAKPLSQRADYWEDDPTISAFIKLHHCEELFLQSLDQRYFTHFEIDIITTKGRYNIHKDSQQLDIYTINPEAGIPSGARLEFVETVDTHHDKAMLNLLDEVSSIIYKRKQQIYPAVQSLATQDVIDSLSKSLRGFVNDKC